MFVDEHSAYIASKILAPLLLFCSTMAFGLCPIQIVDPSRRRTDSGQTRDSKVISFTACFGGGVLFATALVHIIPEARAGFEHWANHTKDHNETKPDSGHDHDHGKFPWTEFVVCLGFLIVYLVDEVIHACLGHRSHVNEDHGHSHSPQVLQCATNGEQANNTNSKPFSHSNSFNQMEGGNPRPEAVRPSSVSIGGLLTVAALSFHSVFEGLSLGLQYSTAKTWLLTLAIATHKLAIAFVVGFELCADGNRKSYVIINIFIFSIMSPIGAFTGFVAQSAMDENTIVVAVLNGIAAGTLLFVVFFEVLQKQKNTSLHGLLQLTAVILGFSMMLLLGRVVAHLSKIDVSAHDHIAHTAFNGTDFHDHHTHSD